MNTGVFIFNGANAMKWLAIQFSGGRQAAAALRVLATTSLLTLALGVAGTVHAAEPTKKVVKPAATKLVKKPAPKVTASRAAIKAKASQMAVGIMAAEAALSPEELAIAQRIHVGQVACELGVSINIKADARMPGYFDLESKRFKFRMFPVVSSTGAIRLQDARADAVWLQLANKSMLMSQKLGSRLADVCMNPAQMAVAAEMEKNPPTSLLEPEKAVAPAVPVRLPAAENTATATTAERSASATTAVDLTPASVAQPEKTQLPATPLATAPAGAPGSPQIAIQ